MRSFGLNPTALALALASLVASSCVAESVPERGPEISLTWDRAVVPRIIGWDSDSSILLALAVRRGSDDVWYRSCSESGLVRALLPSKLVPVRVGGSACDIAFSAAVAYAAATRVVLYAPDSQEGHLFTADVEGRYIRRFRPECRIVGDWLSASSRTGEVAFVGVCSPSKGAAVFIAPPSGRAHPVGGFSFDEEDLPKRSTSLALASDGTRIALGALAADDGDSLTVVDLRMPTARTVPRAGFAPAWSPDGEWLAFLRDGRRRELVVLDMVSGASEVLAAWDLGGVAELTTTHPPAWSPDGRSLAIVSNDSLLLFPRAAGASRVGLLFR